MSIIRQNNPGKKIFKVVYSFDSIYNDSALRKSAFKSLNANWRSVKLNITERCNLRCKNCYIKPKGEELPQKLIFSLLDQLKDKSVRLDILGGEPLLRGNLVEIVAYAKKNLRKGKIFIFTNGTLVTDDLALRLKKAGLDTAIVALHSHIDTIHESMTQIAGSWHKTVAGISAFLGAGIRTFAFTVITSYNVDHLDKIEMFARKLKAGILYFPYIDQSENDNLRINDNGKFQSAIEWAIEKSYRHKKVLKNCLRRGSKICLAFTDSITIQSDGSVIPCPYVEMELGNIKKESLFEILQSAWLNPELAEFLSLPDECRQCSIADICGGGCKAIRYTLYRDARSKDSHCAGPYKAEINIGELGACIPYLF